MTRQEERAPLQPYTGIEPTTNQAVETTEHPQSDPMQPFEDLRNLMLVASDWIGVLLFIVRGIGSWGRVAWGYSLVTLAIITTFTLLAKADNIDHDNARWQPLPFPGPPQSPPSSATTKIISGMDNY